MITIVDLRGDIPEDMIPLLTKEAYRAIAEEDATGIGLYEDDVPAGVVEAAVDGGAGTIEYLFVPEAYRRKGFATELIYRLGALFSSYEDVYRMEVSYSDAVSAELDAFFRSLDFTVEEEESLGEYTITLGDAAKSPVLQKAKPKGVVPFSSLDSVQRKGVLGLSEGAYEFYHRDRLEKDMSCMVLDEDNTKSSLPTLFFGEVEDAVVMIWARTADDKLSLIPMLKYALEAGLQKYGEAKTLRLPYINTESRRIIEKLVGEAAKRTETVRKGVYPLEYEEEELPETEETRNE